MHIVHIASEIAPAAKAGGLGDVIRGLSRELVAQGHQVEVILPKYAGMDYTKIDELTIVQRDLWSVLGNEWCHNTVWTGVVSNVRVYFIEAHNQSQFFSRTNLYGYSDDIERFTYFSRVALEFLLKSQKNPDILHLHEWQTAVAAPLYWDIYHGMGLDNPAVVFTIHNLEHQGHCRAADLDRIGMKGDQYLAADKLQHDANPYVINLLKGGIVYSNCVTTVSPTYAKEIRSVAYGFDLHETISYYQGKIQGILNGLDYSHWNPQLDPYLPYAYGPTLSGLKIKEKIKEELRHRLMLAEENRPIVTAVARLVPQKGVELIRHAIFHTLSQGGQFILLGSSPIPSIQEEFYQLKLHFSDSPHVHLEMHQHEELTHLIYAGADLFLMPSRFEPCGLTQLISLAYGTVPIVRRTGGLADTIYDIDFSERPSSCRNGYVFDESTVADCNAALDRAIQCWYHDPEKWKRLVLHGMHMDFGWQEATKEYIEVYRKARKTLGKEEEVVSRKIHPKQPRQQSTLLSHHHAQ